MDLDQALREFDRTETNLRRLMRVNEDLDELIPDGISFPGGSPEALQYNDLRRSFAELAAALPAVGRLRIEVEPLTLDEIAQQRMDANDISEPQILVSLSQELAAPAEAIAEYRHRFVAARRRLVRERVQELVGEVDGLLPVLVQRHESERQSLVDDEEWQRLVEAVSEIRRLLADRAVGPARWGDLARHLHFALGVDLHDIANHDWPSVREDIEYKVYAEDEPLPVRVTDLDAVVASRPSGPVTTRLAWRALADDDFERLVFNLLGDAPGYHNPEWLTHTKAADRGRDLSVERAIVDPLSGTRSERVIVQCKHWTSRSIGPTDASDAVTKARLWTSPPFDALVIVTTGRFTTDAVAWIEDHNRTNRLTVEMWPDSRLEMLLATRAYLVEEFKLRLPASGEATAQPGGLAVAYGSGAAE